MTRKEKRLAKEQTEKQHHHKYSFYREQSYGMSPDAGCVYEEWRCAICGDIIRRNERVLEDKEWWNR